MTNILLLPQLDGSKTSFTIPLNGDWIDTLYFSTPGSSATTVVLTGSVTGGSNVFTVNSQSVNLYTLGIVPGMAFWDSPEFPNGGFVGQITSSTALTLVTTQGGSAPLNATASNAELTLSFQPLPLDLTGIEFRAHVRPIAGSGVLLLSTDTTNGLLINGGTTGMISFQVPYNTVNSKLQQSANSYVLDILAIADGHVINLFPTSPASVIINPGVTTYP